MYTINNSYHFHEKQSSGSATFKTIKEMEYAYFLAGGMDNGLNFIIIKNMMDI